MKTETKKYIILTVAFLGLSILSYFLYEQIILWSNYTRNVTLEEANMAIDTPNMPMINSDDAAIEAAAEQAQLTGDGGYSGVDGNDPDNPVITPDQLPDTTQ